MKMKHLLYAISALSAFTGMIVNDDFWAKSWSLNAMLWILIAWTNDNKNNNNDNGKDEIRKGMC